MKVSIDFETRSPVDLKTRGAFVYFEHPETAVLMAAYRIDGGPLNIWTYDQPPPHDLCAAIEAGAEITAWNAQFESLGFDLLADRHGWPRPRLEQYRDTAAAAAAMALPRSLGEAAEALGLSVQKDKEGARLIRLFSIPRKPRKGEPPGLYWNEPADHPADWELFKKYCLRDVEVEETIAKRIVPLSDSEQALWHLDQRINRRGLRIDRTSAISALRLAEKAKKVLDAEMKEATGGAVIACSQVSKLVEWIQSQDVALDSLAKAEITDLLEKDDLPPQVRRALELRQEAAKTSVSKLKALLARSSDDGRMRGSFLFCGARTRRWSSSGANVANLPRPRKEFSALQEEGLMRPAPLFDAFRSESPEYLRLLYGDELGRPLHLISDALRSFIWAAPHHELVQADYSGIEGAVAAWGADEHWKVQALHEIIADSSLPDMYRRTAASILGLPVEVVTKKHWARQAVGKVSELACFGPDTQVLTHRGLKSIVAVQNDDLLWDGVEWVAHKGVVPKGRRPTIDLDGIAVTPDHLIRTGPIWRPAQQLASSVAALHRALATGSENLPLPATSSAPLGVSSTSSLNARADRRALSQSATFAAVRAHVAESARGPRRRHDGKSIGGTLTSCLTMLIDVGYSIVSQLASIAAATLTTAPTLTMAGGAFASSGGATNELSSRTWSRLTGGMRPNSSSTASRSIGATSQEISGLSHARSTPEIGVRRASCNNASSTSRPKSPSCTPVYDILEAGPRNRFTVFSRSGALIVHNCGFGGGVMAFVSMARAYNVKLDPLFPGIWERTDDERREKAVKRYESTLKRGREGTDAISREAWLACEITKVGWRAANPKIAAAWHAVEDAARQAIREPGRQVSTLDGRATYLVARGFLWLRLASGGCLAYGSPRLRDQVWAKVRLPDGTWSDPEVMDREAAEQQERKNEALIQGPTSPSISALGVDSVTKKWTRSHLYGGLLFENWVQATARDLLVNGMLLAEGAGYPLVYHNYDEVVAEVPRGSANLKAFETLICQLPEWAKTGPLPMPLTAGGFIAKRYKKD